MHSTNLPSSYYELGHLICAREMKAKRQGPYPHGTGLGVKAKKRKKSKWNMLRKELTRGAAGMTVETS